MQYYVFETEKLAAGAETYIHALSGCPLVGGDGIPQPNAPREERWAIPYARATDGKWVLPRLPVERLGDTGDAIIATFTSVFPHTIEDYSPDWQPEEGI